MTHKEYVSRIGALTQELTGLAAEYFSTHRDPYEIASERFAQAVRAFEEDYSTRKAEFEARKTAANVAVDTVALEQKTAQDRLVEAIQQGKADAEREAAEELDRLAAKKQAAVTRADAFKYAQVYGSKSLFKSVIVCMRDIMEIESNGIDNDRKCVYNAIQDTINLLKEQLPSDQDRSNFYKEKTNAMRCFDAFEKSVGRIDLTAQSCGGSNDVKYRIGMSLARKEISPGLSGTPSETALRSIFEEWDSQPEEESETE